MLPYNIAAPISHAQDRIAPKILPPLLYHALKGKVVPVKLISLIFFASVEQDCPHDIAYREKACMARLGLSLYFAGFILTCSDNNFVQK